MPWSRTLALLPSRFGKWDYKFAKRIFAELPIIRGENKHRCRYFLAVSVKVAKVDEMLKAAPEITKIILATHSATHSSNEFFKHSLNFKGKLSLATQNIIKKKLKIVKASKMYLFFKLKTCSCNLLFSINNPFVMTRKIEGKTECVAGEIGCEFRFKCKKLF